MKGVGAIDVFQRRDADPAIARIVVGPGAGSNEPTCEEPNAGRPLHIVAQQGGSEVLLYVND